MRESRILGLIWYADPVERGQRKDADCIVLNRIGSEAPAIAPVDEAKPEVSMSSDHSLGMEGVYISYVPFVELMPAVQKDTLGLGGLPLVVWFHHSCFAGSNTETVDNPTRPSVVL